MTINKQTNTDMEEFQKKLNENGSSQPEEASHSLNTQTAASQKQTGIPESGGAGFKYNAYQESDSVKQAQTLLQQQLASKPGQYVSPWQAQLNDTINKILNREKFSYDLNGDALYQQYKDQYINQGRMAMMDTMGQAAALTGGYGNSYAQGVGQQAYQGYLQQLNDKIPELYQLAMNRYQMEGDELNNRYSVLGTQDQMDYGRYRDTVSDWQMGMDRYLGQYNAERDFDYSRYADDRNYQYQIGRDQAADAQWQKEFDEAVRQFNFQNKLGEFAPVASSGGSGGTRTYNANPPSEEEPEAEEVQWEDSADVEDKLDTYVRNGASKSEISAYIREKQNNQKISSSYAADLRDRYLKKGAY